jgi:hypothetical protein
LQYKIDKDAKEPKNKEKTGLKKTFPVPYFDCKKKKTLEILNEYVTIEMYKEGGVSNGIQNYRRVRFFRRLRISVPR